MRNDERNKGKSGRIGLGLGVALLLLGGCYTGVDEPVAAQPRSLRGVDVDGTLTVSSSGDFELDADARAFFDHFVAAQGEVDEAELHAWVHMEIDRRLSGAAAEQAWEAFLAYLDYRSEAAALLQSEVPLEPGARLRALAEIRARTIGSAPGVPDEGPRLRAALALHGVLADPQLAAEVRAQRIAGLQAELVEAPDPDAPSRRLGRVHAALAPIAVDDTAARRAVLNELVGEAAAERWLALEHRRAEALTGRG